MKKLGALIVLLVVAVPASAGPLPILASQDLWPVFSPDGRYVAYSVSINGQGRRFALEVVDARTRRVARIGQGLGQLSPTWSGDGRIAFASGGVLWKASPRGTARYRSPSRTPALAPAWRPRSEQLAYLTSNGADNLDLWVANALWAKGAIGKPAWSPDGSQLAFARSGSMWTASRPLVETQLAVTGAEPGSPVWSPDGTRLAYAAAGRVYVVPADASAPPVEVAGRFPAVGPLSWAPAGDALAYTIASGVELTTLQPAPHSSLLVAGAGSGTSFGPTDPRGRVLAYAGPLPRCPAHTAIRIFGQGVLAGTCLIVGTPGADLIEGTQSFGDVIQGGAGNDRIDAADGRADRVDCGPGKDTVTADRTDVLSQCELVRR